MQLKNTVNNCANCKVSVDGYRLRWHRIKYYDKDNRNSNLSFQVCLTCLDCYDGEYLAWKMLRQYKKNLILMAYSLDENCTLKKIPKDVFKMIYNFV